jgi:hypothetical protein
MNIINLLYLASRKAGLNLWLLFNERLDRIDDQLGLRFLRFHPMMVGEIPPFMKSEEVAFLVFREEAS